MTPEQEWRQLLLREIRDLKKEVHLITEQLSNLKIKVAGISSITTLIVTIVIRAIFK